LRRPGLTRAGPLRRRRTRLAGAAPPHRALPDLRRVPVPRHGLLPGDRRADVRHRLEPQVPRGARDVRPGGLRRRPRRPHRRPLPHTDRRAAPPAGPVARADRHRAGGRPGPGHGTARRHRRRRPGLSAVAAATRWTVAGVLGGVLTVVGAAMFAALTLNWRGTIDATYHLDYIYQLAGGNLPAPYGVRFTPDGPLPHERQYASAHPPLYYALVLALAGGAEPADWVRVVLTGRLLNVALGAVTVLLLGWAGWSLGGRSRHRLAVATAATGALSVSFVRFAGEIYGDVLLTTLATAGLVLAIRMLRAGPSRRRVLATAAVCGLGMLTKA